MDTWGEWSTFGAGMVVIVGALAGLWFKYGQPKLAAAQRFFGRADEAFNGRPETRDSYGRVLAPAVPALAEQIGVMADAVRELVSHREEIEHVKSEAVDLRGRVTDLEAGQARLEAGQARLESAAVERVVTKAESAAAWRAVEAVAQRDPDETND